jgi:alkanesulfonate monooxygenase SsuD/methylene tetrahydromethanopterin reductase-like flavin-dependent oxidoreductase (luciferase family)
MGPDVSETPALGLVLGSTQRPRDIVAAATAAQEAGLDELWLGEDYFYTGAFGTAGTLLATTSLPVGIGIVPATTRHPAVTAMEIATLAELHPGRVRGGIGSRPCATASAAYGPCCAATPSTASSAPTRRGPSPSTTRRPSRHPCTRG